MSTIIVVLGLFVIAALVFVNVSPAVLAQILRRSGPIALTLLGVGLILLKQTGLGMMALFAGLALWRRSRRVGRFGPSGPSVGQHSHVRSAALEMELDHSTGEMNGVILAGRFEGEELSKLADDELFEFRDEVSDDPESLSLLDAYLDRRLPGWREDTDFDARSGQGSPSGSGPMGKEEAYEVLGIAPGSSAADIRKAHRRLMKTAHPDSGGSTFLAAKINEAKDVLLGGHS